MSDKILCPVDHTEMTMVGDHGIVDYDGNWDAQATKYECSAEKKHTIFVVDSDAVEDPYEPAFEDAEAAIVNSLKEAMWRPTPYDSYIQLKSNETNPVNTYEPPIKSLDDLRSELAHRAVFAFKDFLEENVLETRNNVEYEYIHAIEDVDDVLSREEIRKLLRKMGWVDQPKDYAKKQ